MILFKAPPDNAEKQRHIAKHSPAQSLTNLNEGRLSGDTSRTKVDPQGGLDSGGILISLGVTCTGPATTTHSYWGHLEIQPGCHSDPPKEPTIGVFFIFVRNNP